jgi:hypothetical protein
MSRAKTIHELASIVADLRHRNPSNAAFGDALRLAGLGGLGHQDRAALLQLAKFDADHVNGLHAVSPRKSPQHFLPFFRSRPVPMSKTVKDTVSKTVKEAVSKTVIPVMSRAEEKAVLVEKILRNLPAVAELAAAFHENPELEAWANSTIGDDGAAFFAMAACSYNVQHKGANARAEVTRLVDEAYSVE